MVHFRTDSNGERHHKMNLWRMEVICDEKNVTKVLQRLEKLTLNKPFPQRVVNVAGIRNGKMVAETSGSLEDEFRLYLKKEGKSEVCSPDVREFVVSVGRSKNSYYTLIQKGLEAGFLQKPKGKKPRGTRKCYVVIKEKLNV